MKPASVLKMFQNRHVLSLTGNVIIAVFSLVSNMMLFRMLSKEEMGSWLLYQMIFIFIDSFRTGFLQTALIKFYSGATDQRRKEIAGATWYIAVLITAFFLIINAGAYFAIGYISNIPVVLVLKWFGITLIATLPFNIAFWILQAEQNFGTILYIRLINQVSFILAITGLFFTRNMSLQGVILAFIGSAALTSMISLLFKWTRFKTFGFRTKQSISDVFHFGKYSVGSFISTTLLRTSDSFIIGTLLGPVALAVYNLPSRLLEVIEILIRSLAATGMSSMSASANQNRMGEVAWAIKKYAGLITVVLIPVVILCVMLSPYLVLILGGEKYVGGDSVNVFRILVLIAVFYPLDRFLGIGLDTIHKPHLNFVKVLIMLTVNISGDLLGIYLFGNIFGVALSTIFTLAAGMLFNFIMLKKFININLNGFLKTGYQEIRFQTAGVCNKIFPVK